MHGIPRVALATAAGVGDSDPDAGPLSAALAARGIEARPAVWDDPSVDWSRFDLVVVRSTWDYPRRRDAFLAWGRHVSRVSRLANPCAVLEWSTDKRYLRELAASDVATVPTTWVEPGQPAAFPTRGEYVVKPAVSAGSKDSARYGPGDEAAAGVHVARLGDQGRVAMVQPYLSRVDTRGETAVVHLDGRYSHAIRKGPLLRRGAGFVDGLFAEEDVAPREPSAAERRLAATALGLVPGGSRDLLYARVDLAPGATGEPVVLELELAEPSLFLPWGAGAADRLAGAIADRLHPRVSA